MRENRKLYIQFVVGENRFVLPAENVVGIVPLANLHEVPRAPDYVSGILNYHGESVPVIDMSKLMSDSETAYRLSARIVLLQTSVEGNDQKILGLLAEKVTEVIRLFDKDFKKSGVKNTKAKYLGDVITDNYGMLQRLNVSELLPSSAKKMLFENAQHQV